MNSVDQRSCFGCRKGLDEPYLCCAECLSPFCYICLNCYAQGKEFGLHESHHSYKIVRNNFSIMEDNWVAAEELKLLDGIMKFGIGNWSIISQHVVTKSKQECERHYFSCYINNPIAELPRFPEIASSTVIHATPIPCRNSNDPPRPAVSSLLFSDMGGYMAGRGDFAVEHDNFAEFDLKNAEFDFEADDLERELQFAALNIYNGRLKERARRKKIIKTHGLLSQRHNFLSTTCYNKSNLVEKMIRFSQLLSFDSLYFILESFHLEIEMKAKVKQFQEYREMGLQRLFSIPTYDYLQQKRLEFQQNKGSALGELLSHARDENSLKLWLRRKAVSDCFKRATADSSPVAHIVRKSAPPLEISGLPGYDKLYPKEREFCSIQRLVPQSFLHFKAVLIGESEKQGGELKLAQARSLIKIDVNKTRKIFDMLLEMGAFRKAASH